MSIDMKGSLGTGKATDFVLAMNRGEDNRLALLIAKEMRLQNNALQGKDMSFITTFSNDGKELFDTLIIENALENSIGLQDLAKAVNTKRLRQSNDEMNFSHLLAKIQDLSKQFEMQLSQDEGVGHIRRLLQKSYSEVARRLSVSCSIFTFTLLGMAFGLSIGRKQSRSRLIFASLYAAFYLLCFLGAKAMDEQAVISMLLYIVPHVVIAGASYRRMVSIHRGMEAA
jgi:lipopolysaccharide export system permease protein